MLDFVSRMVERYPDSADPLKEPAICIVDEIDLHLHPAWQRKLIGFLSERFPNTQFIATAHSPLVVQAAENANIAVFKRVGDHVEIHNDMENIRNWRVDQILTSDLFGLESTRSPEVEKLLARNEELLAKAKLTAAEKRELKDIQQKIEELPTWANPGEKRDLEKIRSILERLERSSPK
jgi:predicted ATP-binding protein involved in virulence